MYTAKKGVQIIAETCRRKGIRKVVFSPGSRSAPLVIAFSQMPDMECLVIPDERVAGYFALGLAQQLHETVAIVCTSGTAVLNLLPAACEAMYQEIPLLFITADRPHGAVRKGENQAINQEGVFAHYVLDMEIDAEGGDLNSIIGTVEEAIFFTQRWHQSARLNVHLAEPLYETTTVELKNIPEDIFRPEAYENTVPKRIEAQEQLAAELKAAEKKLIIVGLKDKSKSFLQKLEQLAQRKDVVVLVESTSNAQVNGVLCNYDSCIALMGEQGISNYIPDIVITFGNQIVSKRIRQLLRKHKPKNHWNIAVHGETHGRDYFELENDEIPYLREEEALETLLEAEEKTGTTFSSSWKQLSEKANALQEEYLSKAQFCDFKVFETLTHSFPKDANIQYGNSTPVRYSNFFQHNASLTINSNRGTSGIDGCLSTAAGAAYANKKMTISVLGDVSFFYDSNGLFHNNLSPLLRIIIINNSGGNIFRLIDGPTGVEHFEKFFETKHNLSAKHLASMYDIPYYFCDKQDGLDDILKTFYQPQNSKPAILEIKTDGELSAKVYREYFNYLKSKK